MLSGARRKSGGAVHWASMPENDEAGTERGAEEDRAGAETGAGLHK